MNSSRRAQDANLDDVSPKPRRSLPVLPLEATPLAVPRAEIPRVRW